MKRIGETVKLRYSHWTGPLPEPGDVLTTSTGRRYQINGVSGRMLDCVVMRPGAKVADDARQFNWVWGPKRHA